MFSAVSVVTTLVQRGFCSMISFHHSKRIAGSNDSRRQHDLFPFKSLFVITFLVFLFILFYPIEVEPPKGLSPNCVGALRKRAYQVGNKLCVVPYNFTVDRYWVGGTSPALWDVRNMPAENRSKAGGHERNCYRAN